MAGPLEEVSRQFSEITAHISEIQNINTFRLIPETLLTITEIEQRPRMSPDIPL